MRGTSTSRSARDIRCRRWRQVQWKIRFSMSGILHYWTSAPRLGRIFHHFARLKENENDKIPVWFFHLCPWVIYSERNSSMLFHPQEKGQGLVEYAIILVFVALVVIAIMRLIGPRVGNIFRTINSSLWETGVANERGLIQDQASFVLSPCKGNL